MDTVVCSVKTVNLKDIQEAIESVLNITRSISHSHSHALILSSSGEATFTSDGSKLLSEITFCHPLTKLITNSAMNYTSLYGDDCKHFIFVLHEIFYILHKEGSGNSENYLRKKLINEIYMVKKILPCIYKCIHSISNNHVNNSKSDSFIKHLYSIVLPFMLSRFSEKVSKMFSALICDFIMDIQNESNSLKNILKYVISHFDMFVCRVISPVMESRVLKGILLYRTHILSLDLQNAKFIIISYLTMEMTTKVSWKIENESFVSKLDPTYIYPKFFEYLKSLNISLLLTSSISDTSFKVLSSKYNIHVIDRLEKEEIEYLTLCLQVVPLENLNESIGSENIGELIFAKSLSCNNSHFFRLTSANPMNFINAHHILLSAPCKTVWKEYYSECLNCLKFIYIWLNSIDNLENHDEFINEISYQFNSTLKYTNYCSLCSELKNSYNDKGRAFDLEDSSRDSEGLLMPGEWEYLFQSCIKLIPERLKLSYNCILVALHLAVKKNLCKKLGISLSHIKDLDFEYKNFFIKNKRNETKFLEPIICKEIMIRNILDLILQLLKIDCIVFKK